MGVQNGLKADHFALEQIANPLGICFGIAAVNQDAPLFVDIQTHIGMTQ